MEKTRTITLLLLCLALTTVLCKTIYEPEGPGDHVREAVEKKEEGKLATFVKQAAKETKAKFKEAVEKKDGKLATFVKQAADGAKAKIKEAVEKKGGPLAIAKKAADAAIVVGGVGTIAKILLG